MSQNGGILKPGEPLLSKDIIVTGGSFPELLGEEEAIQQVLEYGKQYGYGNLINHLQMAWSDKLVNTYGMKRGVANQATEMKLYKYKKEEM